MESLNKTGQQLLAELSRAKQSDETTQKLRAQQEKVNIVGAGGALTAAYEQLRNAAENTEEHLLVQKAIRRFYRQLFVTHDEQLIRESGDELAIELTFAGYVPNDTLTRQQVEEFSQIAAAYYGARETLQTRQGINQEKANGWILDALACQIAQIIHPHYSDAAYVNAAYRYFSETMTPAKVAATNIDPDEYSTALFAAVHKALLKSDVMTIRGAVLDRYQVVAYADTERFIAYNQRIDAIVRAKVTDTLYHMIDHQGAPFRIIRQMVEDKPNVTQLLLHRDVFLDEYEKQVNHEYANIMRRVNHAIVRGVIFLVITKVLIGASIEVPYDLLVYGSIHWQPLIINLLFPPLYMVALRLTLNVPGYANTTALVDHVAAILYDDKKLVLNKKTTPPRYNTAFSVVYGVFALVIFAAVTYGLMQLGFAWIHIIIFFIVISGARFLGFRLSHLIRELEIVKTSNNGLTMIRDLVYLPFVVLGRWMSEKYAQVNIVAAVLDMVIELPLKTVLRLIRQWGAFLDDRKDNI